MRALHRATLSLYADLSPERVLQRIVQAARDLAGARYAALGIPAEGGGLETFITTGMDDEDARRIPHRPVGKGLIGEMLRVGRSIRIPEIADHPASIGFPPGHPPMHSFLGVPIAAFGRPLGQIYLTDKREAPAFSEEDQQLIEMLAAHAAAAIENSKLHNQVLKSQGELSQRNEELGLINTMATAVGSTMDLDTLLDTMLQRVIDLFEAGVGEIFLREESGATFMRAVHRGSSAAALWRVDRFRGQEGILGLVAKSGEPVWTNSLASEAEYLAEEVVAAGLGTLVAVPLTSRGQVVGVLSLGFSGERAVSNSELGLLTAVGAGVGIAVENARLYRQARRLAVLEERERIGMDLHDGIIQSIYAVGLTLEYTRMLVQDDPVSVGPKLAEAVDGLNAVIRDIRAYILDLQPARFDKGTLDDGLRLLLREFKANTLAETELNVDVEALDGLTRDSSATLFHVTQEALANAGKHARPSRVAVSLRRRNARVELEVRDNGRGFSIDEKRSTLGHGLSNMSERARQAGGEFEIASSPGGGTVVTVRLPATGKRRMTEKARPKTTAGGKPG
ncbi:MAG: hypothetical protein A2Y93_01290 [Chloroflexi bacterium RBG_13_68_17]|nr:MAG: hypothetical protein A2Y93_01290 [Chloroflexi bacterium RBG_13_68_17]